MPPIFFESQIVLYERRASISIISDAVPMHDRIHQRQRQQKQNEEDSSSPDAAAPAIGNVSGLVRYRFAHSLCQDSQAGLHESSAQAKNVKFAHNSIRQAERLSKAQEEREQGDVSPDGRIICLVTENFRGEIVPHDFTSELDILESTAVALIRAGVDFFSVDLFAVVDELRLDMRFLVLRPISLGHTSHGLP